VGEWKCRPMSNESVPESKSTSEDPSTSNGPSETPAIEVPVGGGMAEFTSAPAAVAAVAEKAAEAAPAAEEPAEDFADILKEFERGHARKPEGGGAKQIEGLVFSVSAEQVFVDIGHKIEGVLPRSAFRNNAEGVKAGEKVLVSIKGRNEEGYYDLTRFQVAQPRDWTALEEAFKQKTAVVGTVTGVVKGGLTVDVGVRAFMPASRSGTRDAAELEQLVGTEITCQITKLDVTDENVVVDRRVVLEEQARAAQEGKLAILQPGEVLEGTVRSLMPYGAFVDLGGFDGLLHVSDISWNRVSKPEDVLSAGQKVRVRVLKIDPETKKISLGLKQLEAEPWETAPSRYQAGQRVTGTITKIMDFGAVVEMEPGVEGLIHISEKTRKKKKQQPTDVVNAGDRVDAV